jgi:hypothetical protein
MKKLGSYLKEDVEILLKEINIEEIDVKIKEKKIQNQSTHYSEMISPEYIPSKEYIKVFYESMELNKNKVATNVIQLSNYIKNKCDKPILISLARAGTPIGVLLQRTLTQEFNINSKHYTISIIRDKEIDNNALNYILLKESEKHGITINEVSKRIFFIDGWTGKGVINRELHKFINLYNTLKGTQISPNLLVLADISGKSNITATFEDYLIPSAALNSTVSGLISRSILNKEFINKTDFHGCKYYKEFESNDLSLWFIDEIMKEIKLVLNNDFYKNVEVYQTINIVEENNELSKKSELFLLNIQKKYNIKDINHIKPGIGETTRVLLRRVPDIIILKDINSKETKHIVKLANEKQIQLIEDENLLYKSVGLIKELEGIEIQ